ncbi:FAD:protein FMN transferase [Enterococcus italicus]|uniref:FAD:protein FMN transferase n=1 Tax=Enterococcus italicus TaxID=246144 RepID=UPI0028A6620D|nr:FAD:protein FMN transferase [Enterococcus italicus]
MSEQKIPSVSTTSQNKLESRSVKGMGTVITLTVYCKEPKAILDWLEKKLKEYEQRFSANDDHSELMAINRAAGQTAVKVHPELFELIQIGKEQSIAAPDLLNIAIGPLIQTWRIGFQDAHVPSKEQITRALSLIDPLAIELNAAQQSVFLRKKGMKIDLGALAKGYIGDCLVSELKRKQVKAGLINLGGNVVVFGPCPLHADGLWKIGIRDPKGKREECLTILNCSEGSVVTSGIYERVLTLAGHRYTHIFDSRTGYPVETDIDSLTIVTKQSLMGEIWTTRLFGYRAEKIQQIMQQKNLEGVIVKQNGQVWLSSGVKCAQSAIN